MSGSIKAYCGLLAAMALFLLLAIRGADRLPAAAKIATPAASPTQAEASCAGADAWLDASWERNQAASRTLYRLLLLVQDGPPLDAPVIASVGTDLIEQAREQAASSPPPAARDLDDLLTERLRSYAEGARRLSTSALRGDDVLGEEGADLVHEGRLIGERIPDVVDEFKSTCGLTDSAAFRAPACYGPDGIRWLSFTQARTIRVDEIVAGAFEAGDTAGFDEVADEVERRATEQERSSPPDEAALLHSLVVDLFRTYAVALRAANEGDFVRVDQLADRAIGLGDRIAAEEERLTAAC